MKRGHMSAGIRTGIGTIATRTARRGRWASVTACGALLAGVVTLGVGAPAQAASTTSAPGVTSTAINTGAISTLTGPIASNFDSLVPGIRAYFGAIDAQGGINHRKLLLTYNLDDGGNPTQFTQLVHTLIDQDHAFAVAGVATAFFSPNYFAATGIPTYGYNVTGNWTPAPNLYAAGGSFQCYKCGVPAWAYLARQVKAKSIAVVGYNITASSEPCTIAANLMKQAGYNVSYIDTNITYPGTTVATDAQKIQQAGSDFLLSCMDVTGNLNLARAFKQYGVQHITQLWLSGNDQPTLLANTSLMQGVYFNISHVPYAMPQKYLQYYPGLVQYLNAMKKYAPKYVLDEIANQGYQGAVLLAQGIKAAGSNLTWANVVAQTNKITNFTANGLVSPTNWGNSHTGYTNPACSAYIQVQGTTFVPKFIHNGHQVFLCFNYSVANVKNPVLVTPPAGTPGT